MLLLLGACRDQAGIPAANSVTGEEVVLQDDPGDSPLARNRLPEPPPAPPPPGSLLPLSQAAIERELPTGARCALGDSARGPLLVAVAGHAIVNESGRIVHLKPDAKSLQQLLRGGQFVGDELVVSVDREHQVERIGKVTKWQATLRVKRGRSGFTSFHHRWSCGV